MGKLAYSLYGFMLAIISAALLYLSFPPVGYWWLSWLSFVPLILAVYSRRPLAAFALAYTCGLATRFMVFGWLWELPGMGVFQYLLLGMYYGLFVGLWGTIFVILPRNRWLLLIAPAAWVMLDYFIANAGFLSSSWATLAQSQYTNLPLIQVASIVGEYGVTFIIMLVNVALAHCLVQRDWRGVILVFFSVGAIHVYGAWELSQKESGESVRIAIVQPALESRERGSPNVNMDRFKILKKLTLEASQSKPELIVWPESSFYRWNNDPYLISEVGTLASQIDLPILLGTSENRKFAAPGRQSPTAEKVYNAAFMVRPDGTVSEPYYKNILMPFGEYIPMEETFPWPENLIPEILPLSPGTEFVNFKLTGEHYLSPIICWENVFSNYVRRALIKPSTIIVQLTNDNAFGRSAGSRQHNISSVYRAVENRTSLVIASNAGPSQIIDRYGRIITEVPGLFEQGWIVSDVRTSGVRTFYTRYGDLFVLAMMLFLVLFSVQSLIRSSLSPKPVARRTRPD